LREAEKANVEIIQQVLPDTPTVIESATSDLPAFVITPDAFVVIDKIRLFFDRHTSEAIVRRVTENHDDLGRGPDLLGCIVLLLKFRKVKFELFRLVPPCECIGQEDRRAITISRCSSNARQDEVQLQLSDDERRGEDLETNDPVAKDIEKPRTKESLFTFAPKLIGDAAHHLDKVGACATTRVEDDYVVVCEPPMAAKLIPQQTIDLANLVLHDLRRCVPNSEFLAQLGSNASRNGS